MAAHVINNWAMIRQLRFVNGPSKWVQLDTIGLYVPKREITMIRSDFELRGLKIIDRFYGLYYTSGTGTLKFSQLSRLKLWEIFFKYDLRQINSYAWGVNTYVRLGTVR